MVRIHAPEPAFLSNRPPIGHKIEGWDGGAEPVAATAADAKAVAAALTGTIRADMERALAAGPSRAIAAGDRKMARVALAALSVLMEDVAEAAPVDGGCCARRRDGGARSRAVATSGSEARGECAPALDLLGVENHSYELGLVLEAELGPLID